MNSPPQVLRRRFSRLLVTVGADETQVWIEVADDGDGVSGSLAELAQPFVKGAASHGSGLGLAIAAEVARAHKGKLALTRGWDGLGPVRACRLRQRAWRSAPELTPLSVAPQNLTARFALKAWSCVSSASWAL